MKKLIYLILILLIQSSLTAQTPPHPGLQPGETWTNLWSVSYDYQSNGSIRYIIQDPLNPENLCAVLMAQQDSNSAVGLKRYIFYSYNVGYANTWISNVLDTTISGFPCISLSNGYPIISAHSSGSKIFRDTPFGGFDFTTIPGGAFFRFVATAYRNIKW